MEVKKIVLNVFVIVIVYFVSIGNGVLRRCFQCRSRGELGSCKDPFTVNATKLPPHTGVEVVPCASGWCGKVLEDKNPLKEDYGAAIQRLCLQRGPPDGEDRCAYTKFSRREVYMCICRGDLCNTSTKMKMNVILLSFTSVLLTLKIIA